MFFNQDKIRSDLQAWSSSQEMLNITSYEDVGKLKGVIENAKPVLKEKILVYPFPAAKKDDEGGFVTGVACELTLGGEVYMTSEETPTLVSGTCVSPFVSIEPGEFAVLITKEYLYLPNNVLGLISMKNTYKVKGLINVSGFHVDPDFQGKLVFTVYNAGPRDVLLREGEKVFMIMFAQVNGPADEYGGQSKGQLRIPISVVSQLKGESVSPRNLDERLQRLETLVQILLIPLASALIIALASFLHR